MDKKELVAKVDKIGEEFARQVRAGKNPQIEDFLAAYPDLKDELNDVLAAIHLTEKPGVATLASNSATHSDSESFPAIDDYQIIREIGKGGMGVVYEARQISLDRQVALKLLPERFVENKTALLRFQREAKSAAALHHTNVVPVFDIGHCNGHHYYAMQLIEGKPLKDVIFEVKQIREGNFNREYQSFSIASSFADGEFIVQPPGPNSTATSMMDNTDATRVDTDDLILGPTDGTSGYNTALPDSRPASHHKSNSSNTGPLGGKLDDSTKSTSVGRRSFFHEIARVGRQVAEALAYAHVNGVIHRDIKPANLLLDSRGNVWVADFGLAKTDEEDLTRTGDVVGTLRYMSPERFAGECTEKSDIYALGVTLYELALLQPCFEHSDFLTLIDAIANKEPTKPRLVDSSIPVDLETIILKSIAKDPQRRYGSASAMADDLTRFLEGRPINARHVSRSERVWIWAKRNPVVSALAATLCVGALLTLVGSVIAAASFRNMAITQKTLTHQANEAYHESQKNLAQLQEEKARGDLEADTALAVNEFLQSDILGQAETSLKYNAEFRADPDLTIRTALDRAAKRIGEAFKDRPLIEMDIRETLGNAYRSVGAYDESVRELSRAFELANIHLPRDDSAIYVIQHNLALSLELEEEFELAEQNCKEALEGLVRTEGLESHNTLTTMISVAHQKLDSFQFGESEKLFKEVQQIAEACNEGDSIESLHARTGLSQIYSNLGQYKKALDEAGYVVDASTHYFGHDHLKTIDARANLARILRVSGKSEMAIEILKSAYDDEVQQRGRTHPDSLATLEELALTYSSLDQFETAIELYEPILEELKEQFGDRKDSVLSTMNALVSLYRELGRFKKAAEFSEHVRSCRLQMYGMDHESTLNAFYSYAALLRDTGEIARSIEVFQDVLDRRQKILGLEHANTIRTITSLANVVRADGRLKQAIRHLEHARELSLKKYGEENADTLSILSNLGGAYRESGNIEKAIETLEHAKEGWLRIYENGSPDMLPTLNNLAVAYGDAGRDKESFELQKEVYEMMRVAWGDDHHNTLNSLANIAVEHWKLGELDKSVPIFEEVVERQTKLLGRDHPKTLGSVANLGINYRDAGRLDEAIPLFEEAYEASDEIFRLRWIGTPLLNAYASQRSSKTVPLAEEILKRARNEMNENSLEFADQLYSVGDVFLMIREFKRAADALKECMSIREKKAPDDWWTGVVALQLGNSLRKLEQFEAAEKLLLQAWQISEQNPDSPDWYPRQTSAALVGVYDELGNKEKSKEWKRRLDDLKKDN